MTQPNSKRKRVTKKDLKETCEMLELKNKRLNEENDDLSVRLNSLDLRLKVTQESLDNITDNFQPIAKAGIILIAEFSPINLIALAQAVHVAKFIEISKTITLNKIGTDLSKEIFSKFKV